MIVARHYRGVITQSAMAPYDRPVVGLTFDPTSYLASDDEPSRFVHEYTGAVTLYLGDDEDTELVVGRFEAQYIDVFGAVNESVSVLDVFDSTAPLHDLYLALYEPQARDIRRNISRVVLGPDEFLPSCSSVLFLDSLGIAPSHRGKGIGLLALLALIERLRTGAALVVTQPIPLQFEMSGGAGDTHRATFALDKFTSNFAVATERLRRYCSRLGFRLVPGTEYMVRPADVALPTEEDLLPRDRA